MLVQKAEIGNCLHGDIEANNFQLVGLEVVKLKCKWRVKKIGIVLLILISLTGTLLGCGKQDVNKDLESIEASEIKQIEHTGTTGGKDGDYSYSFSDDEVIEFINLLNQVKLGDEVDENKALSSGAVSYYTIHLATDETLTISPGKYFKVADRYYEFDNYDELWDEFIVFNSIK